MSDGRRKHDISACGAGDAGVMPVGKVIGACPSCGAELSSVQMKDPRTGQVGRALAHPAPFCSYFGETDPATIEREITA